MDYVKIEKVKTVEELKRVDFYFLLKSHDEKELMGLWYDAGGDLVKLPVGELVKDNVKLAVVIHGRLYVEEAEVLRKGNTAWIEENKYMEYF